MMGHPLKQRVHKNALPCRWGVRAFSAPCTPRGIFPLQIGIRNVNRCRDFPLNFQMGNKNPSPPLAGIWMLHEQIPWIFFIYLGEVNVLPPRKLPTAGPRSYWVNKGCSGMSRGRLSFHLSVSLPPQYFWACMACLLTVSIFQLILPSVLSCCPLFC